MDRGASVQVLGKVALILDRLADEEEVGASRLADLIGEPRSTVYRLLSSLQGLDMVEPGTRRGTWDEYVSRQVELEAWTPHTPTSQQELYPLLEEVRGSGCSISNEDVALGMAAVGAAIRDYRGGVCAALSMSGPVATILGENEQTSRALVTDGAAEISRGLGYAPEPEIAQRL